MIGSLTYGDVELEMTYCDVGRKIVRSSDDTTYLYTEWTLDVLAVYNPKATSYTGKNNLTPSTTAFAGETDLAIRERLAQPRQVLTVNYGDHNGQSPIFLQSPPQNPKKYPTDAKNGPVCDVMTIKEHHGTKTFICHLRFTTWVNDCLDSESPMLSHRVKRTVDVDEDFYTTIVTQGEAIFNVGRLWRENQSPDFFRSEFFAEPLGNFKRIKINVEVSEDNTTARYSVIDRSQAFNLGTNSPATRVEAYLTTGYSAGSVMRAGTTFGTSALGHLADFSANVTMWDPARDAGLGTALAMRLASSATAAICANLPKYYATINIRAWGSETSQRIDLLNLCVGIANARMGAPDFLTASNTTDVRVSQELTGKYVEFEMTLRWSDEIIAGLALFISTLTPGAVTAASNHFFAQIAGRLASNGATFYRSYFPADENISMPGGAGVPPRHVSQASIGNRPPGAGAGPMDAFGTPIPIPDTYVRGPKYLQKLIAQGLIGQCENPDVVGTMDSVRQRS